MEWLMMTWTGEEGGYYVDIFFGTQQAISGIEDACCPILMEKLGEAEVDGVPNSRALQAFGFEFVAARLPCCNKLFHPIALAVHWMLHGMRCPMCRDGCNLPMSADSLPPSCRDQVKEYVEEMRKEMRQEEADEAFDDIDLDLSPIHDLMTDITFLRQWDFVYPNLQLQAILHMSPYLVPRALETLNGQTPYEPGLPYWTQCSTGIHTFLNIAFEQNGIEAPRNFSVQRNQCRKISRALQAVRPVSMSFGLCYAEGSDGITQIARSNMIALNGMQRRMVGCLSFSNEDQVIQAGIVHFSLIEEGSKSIESIACEVEPDKIISRLVHGRIVAFQHSHGFVHIDSVEGFSVALTI